MNTIIKHSEDEFDQAAAMVVVDQIRRNPRSVIGLSPGRTTHNMHRIAARIIKDSCLDLNEVTFFCPSEIVGIPDDFSRSCREIIETEILNEIGVKRGQFLTLPSKSSDFKKACDDFDLELKKRGGVDLLIIGIGINGRIALNHPGTPFGNETGLTKIDTDLEARIKNEIFLPDNVWITGVTIGIKEIMNSRHIVMLAKGEKKAQAVAAMLRGPVTTNCPASVLQLHPELDVLLDSAAANNLVC